MTTNPTPSSRALEEKIENAIKFPLTAFNMEDEYVLEELTLDDIKRIRRALRIAHAVDSGELRREINVPGDHPCYLQGHNAVLDKLKAMGSE